jgi:hypothetical protein
MGQSYSDEEESYDDSDGDGASPRGTTTSAPPPTSLKIETAAPPPAAVRVVSERRRSSVSVEAERKKARREEFLCELAALAAVDTASLDADGSTALDARISRADAFLDKREKIATADLILARAKATRAAAEIAKLKAELDALRKEKKAWVSEQVTAIVQNLDDEPADDEAAVPICPPTCKRSCLQNLWTFHRDVYVDVATRAAD